MTMLIGLIFALFVVQMSAKPASESAELTVVSGNGLFAKNMYKELTDKPGNVFFSPISAHAVLSLVFQGAVGETRDAFAKVLNVPDETSAAEGYHHVMNRLNSVENVTLLMANKVYLMNTYELQDGFKKAATEKFLSDVEKVDFADNVKTAGVINHWVEEKTHDKIKDLIKSDKLDADTRLVLVNAIYFKGNWANQFKKKNTQKKPFYINENDHVEVDMMFQSGDFKYKYDQDLEAQVLELPYTNKDLSLVIILPKERTGIKNLEQKLQNVDLTKITENMYLDEVEVHLPKFKIETTIKLNNVLEKMGLGIIFDGSKANFSKLITGGEPLVVSEVIQKAFIEVNEEGAEAAAATGVLIVAESARIPVIFEANHPFIVVLQQNVQTDESVLGKLNLFLGKYVNNQQN